MKRLVLLFALAVVALTPVGNGNAGRAGIETRTCLRGDVAAVIDGAKRCLREWQLCEPFLDNSFHRHGFHCHGRLLTTDWRALSRRPLRLPMLAPGAPCPRTIGQRRNEPPPYGSRPLLGGGPAYPIPASSATFDPLDPNGTIRAVPGRPAGTAGVWYQFKILWLVSRSYHGPLVIRGRQLDGTGPLRFWRARSDGPAQMYAAADLRIPAGRGELRNGWRDMPSLELARGPGCYGFQVDGRTFTRTVALQVTVD